MLFGQSSGEAQREMTKKYLNQGHSDLWQTGMRGWLVFPNTHAETSTSIFAKE